MSKLSLHVRDFRAIANAEIDLAGITVISGVNSAGKSTLSKLLYEVVKLTIEQEAIITKNLINEIRVILNSLSRLLDDYQLESREFQAEDKIGGRASWFKEIESSDIESIHAFFFSVLDDIEKSFLLREEKKSFSKQELIRISNALDTRALRSLKLQVNSRNVSELFDTIRDKTSELFDKALDNIKRRPLQEVQARLGYTFKEAKIPVSLFEDEIPIIDYSSGRLNNLFSIQQVFYSDTPMAISDYVTNPRVSSRTGTSHWDYLKQTILDTPTVILDEEQKQVAEEIRKIINGSVSLEESEYKRGFNYKRATDGLTIDLTDSATGIKSFAILQLLLSEGLLTETTLLILDEPEAHLHPQWIVEYARVLVLLNKQLGVKFMVASHNPDMVSALRYISEKEGILDNMHFYLAERVEGTEQFNYRNLKNDIEPIFASFNIALERINQYGV